MPAVTVTTWNVNSIRQRIDHVAGLLRDVRPDILLLQETKVEDSAFPSSPIRDLGYSLVTSGQKTWNGVAIASLLPLDDVSDRLPNGYSTPERRILAATVAGFRLVNVYVPNGGSSAESFAGKLLFLDALLETVLGCAPACRLLLGGDFNVAPADDDVYDPVALNGMVCFHPEERARLNGMTAGGAVDLFRRFTPKGKAYSWWDYRQLGFQRDRGMRLDHLVASPALAACATACSIDRTFRMLQKPSDHAPVSVAFGLPEQAME
jgi:exodeoxyribonuclease-3